MLDTFTICDSHKKKYLDYFGNSEVNCFDPFKKHAKKVNNSTIRALDFQTALDYKKFSKDKINLTPGIKLCLSCRKQVSENIEVINFKFLFDQT